MGITWAGSLELELADDLHIHLLLIHLDLLLTLLRLTVIHKHGKDFFIAVLPYHIIVFVTSTLNA